MKFGNGKISFKFLFCSQSLHLFDQTSKMSNNVKCRPNLPKYYNWLCHPLQQQLLSSVCNQYLAMSLSHCCGAILSHSSFQNCFNTTTLEGFQAWMDCLRSCHGILIGFKSGLWFGHSKTLILFFLSHSEVDLLVCLGSLSCCITQACLRLRSQTDGWTFSFRIFQ